MRAMRAGTVGSASAEAWMGGSGCVSRGGIAAAVCRANAAVCRYAYAMEWTRARAAAMCARTEAWRRGRTSVSMEGGECAMCRSDKATAAAP